MGSHPINLAIRFVLELSALVAMGLWAWHQGEGILRYLFALIVPVIAATLWGSFAVLNDPSRSGKAPVPVRGSIRLALEVVFFAFATWSFFAAGETRLGWIFGIVALIHYAVSYDRLLWLIRH